MPVNLIAGAVGALAGAVVSGAAVALTQAARGEIDWRSVGSAALGGALAGGVGGLTLGASLVVGGGAMVAGGAAGGVVERTADNLLHGRVWHDDVAKHAAAGGAIGFVGAAGRPLLAPASRALRPAAGAVSRTVGRGWRAYGAALERRPLLTKSLTSGAVTAGGDAVAQAIEGQRFDVGRMAFMGAFGLVWVGPSGHAWHGLLTRVVPGRGAAVVGKRLLLDQVVMAPVGTGVFLTALGAYQGDSPGEVVSRVRRDTWPMLKQGYVLWPAANLVNFSVVPTRYRVLFGNGVGLGWNTWVSLRTMNDRPAAAPEPDAGLAGGPVLPGRRSAEAALPVAPSSTSEPVDGRGGAAGADDASGARSAGLVRALRER